MDTKNSSKPTSESRRNFVLKSAYVAPAILTLKSAPSFARAGSETPVIDSKPPQPRID